jgi:hypothetical protein
MYKFTAYIALPVWYNAILHGFNKYITLVITLHETLDEFNEFNGHVVLGLTLR